MTDEETSKNNRPFLRDILVLDLAPGGAAFCSRLLADLGASVIKVEPPAGDPARGLGHGCAHPAFPYHNANKLGVVVDPARREDLALLHGLIGRADVLIDAGAGDGDGAAMPGLSPERTLAINPALVHLSISGFGGAGPKAPLPWCDEVVSAFAGQAYLTGLSPGPPRALPCGQSFYAASLFGAVAVLLAVRDRRATGKGRHIDLSAQEALASALDHVMVDYFRDGTVCRRQGNLYGNGSYAVLPAADGHVLLSLSNDWETLRELMAAEGKGEDLSGEEWQEESYRAAHGDRVAASAGEWTRLHPKDELFTLGQAMRFPWAPVYGPEEVLESPQLAARGFFVRTSPGGEPVPMPGPPYRFRFFSPPPPRPAPGLGEHGRLVSDGPGPIPGRPASGTGERAPHAAGGDPRGAGKPVLHGIRVVDFTWMLAGPYATRVLADFGAEVIKVQSLRATRGGDGSDPVYDAAWNRNKKSIALDLDRPEAREIVSRLVSSADVVVENFSPRVMANWGFTYDELKAVKPDIIMASISAMGGIGPWKDYVGFGPTFHALSGLVAEASRGQAAPVCPNHAYGDTVIGLYAALAILAALERRGTTGLGEHIDLSGYEAVCTLLGPALIAAAREKAGGRGKAEPDRPGPGHTGFYPCLGADRWCVVAFRGEPDWERFCTVAGLPAPGDERPSSAENRTGRWAGRDAAVSSWTAGRPAADAVDVLRKSGLAAAVVQDARELAGDPQLLFRRFFVSLDHPALGALRSDRSALPLPDLARREWKAAPRAGEDTASVLGQILGLSPEEIRIYADAGIIGGNMTDRKTGR